MNRFKIALLLILFTPVLLLAKQQPDNGFYFHGNINLPVGVISQDGKKLFLGEKIPLKLLSSKLSSQDNANTKFYLSVTIPYDVDNNPSKYILLVDGIAYRQIGSGSSHKKTSSLSFNVSGEVNAKKVSKYLKTTVKYRKHPKYQLRVSFVPTKEVFHVKDEVIATLRITNVGNNHVSFMKGGRNRAARDNQYIFSASFNGKQVQDIGTSYHHGGIATRRIIKPGDVFEDDINLNKWFSFDKTGFYEVHGSYYLSFNDPDDESLRTIWEDYVSADFHIRIEKEK